MLKRWSIVMIVVALVALAAMPAGAAPAEKTSYIVAECSPDPYGPDPNPQSVERMEFPTPDRILVRGAVNIYYEYLLDDGVWTLIGENDTVANINATFPDFMGPAWGTFHYSDDGTIGEFFGTWSWGNSPSGRAAGKDADGRLLKVTLGMDPSPYSELPFGYCFVNEYVVIDPHA